MSTYKIIRKFQSDLVEDQELQGGLTLEQAQEHCSDPETSYRTCTSQEGKERTEQFGPWFDAFYPELEE
jgi:hypothetical protein